MEAAQTFGFPVERIIFEITEGEQVADFGHLREIVSYYRERGFITAIDDFGADYSGLNMLAELLKDVVKLDMALIRDIDKNRERRVIVKGITQVCTDLGIRIVGEGVETGDELSFLRDLGIELFQGYYFARPGFESMPHQLWRRLRRQSSQPTTQQLTPHCTLIPNSQRRDASKSGKRLATYQVPSFASRLFSLSLRRSGASRGGCGPRRWSRP